MRLHRHTARCRNLKLQFHLSPLGHVAQLARQEGSHPRASAGISRGSVRSSAMISVAPCVTAGSTGRLLIMPPSIKSCPSFSIGGTHGGKRGRRQHRVQHQMLRVGSIQHRAAAVQFGGHDQESYTLQVAKTQFRRKAVRDEKVAHPLIASTARPVKECAERGPHIVRSQQVAGDCVVPGLSERFDAGQAHAVHSQKSRIDRPGGCAHQHVGADVRFQQSAQRACLKCAACSTATQYKSKLFAHFSKCHDDVATLAPCAP